MLTINMRRFLTTFVVVALCKPAFAAQPFGNLTFSSGRVREVTTPIPELTPDEEITGLCVLGTFAIYDTPYFRHTSDQVILWSYEREGHCFWIPSFAGSSARPVAHTVDTRYPFAALYDMHMINSDEVVVETGEGLFNIDMPIHSILMHLTSVELFSEPNFSGESFCIHGCSSRICIYNYMSGIPGERPFDITQTKSARLGCSAADRPSAMSQRLGDSDSSHGFAKFSN